jgi:hypothetical protein
VTLLRARTHALVRRHRRGHVDRPYSLAKATMARVSASFDPLQRLIKLCPSPLSQQPAGMPFAHPVLLACMLYRTTSPLRA